MHLEQFQSVDYDFSLIEWLLGLPAQQSSVVQFNQIID
jgi:hypothetical protein